MAYKTMFNMSNITSGSISLIGQNNL